MAFFDEFARKAGKAKDEVFQKTQDLSEIAKLSGNLSEEERVRSRLLQQIGECYVRLHMEDFDTEFSEIISEYQETEKRIRAIRLKIQTIKGIRICEVCGAEVSRYGRFCHQCGNPLPELEEIIPEGFVKCMYCNAIVSSDMCYCTNCGEPLVPQPEKLFCTNCGTELSPDDMYCPNCGFDTQSENTDVQEFEE